MPAVQAIQVGIRHITANSDINNRHLVGQPCIKINFPYNAALVDEIKSVIPSQQRAWTGESWIILKDDPDQQPDQQTNLEWLRDVLGRYCQLNKWQLCDYTSQSKSEIEEATQKTEAELLEQHIQAVVKIIDRLPNGSLRLISWREVFKLQLEYFIDKELFDELHHACTKAWKPLAYGSGDFKIKIGFVFEMANDDRILRALMQKKTRFLTVHELEPIAKFDNGIMHFRKGGRHFSGCDHHLIDLSDLDFDSKSWEVAEVGGTIYWVVDTEEFLSAWLEQRCYSPMGVAGAFSFMMKNRSKLPEILHWLNLQDWFRAWANLQIGIDELQTERYPKAAWRVSGWQHPADKLIRHIEGFGSGHFLELLGFSLKEWQSRLDRIQQLKQTATDKAIASAIENADQLLEGKVGGWLKADLMKLANKHGIEVKDYWSKGRIIQAIQSDRSACYKILEIPTV